MEAFSWNLFIFVLAVYFLEQGFAQFGHNRPPVFLSSGDLARFSLAEDTTVGSVIYRLKGADPENGELTYSISGEYFRVNKKTGDITLIKALDRENEASIDVIISLTDDGNGGEPATISLRREILVIDVNDNPPIFENTPYRFEVSEKTQVGSTVYSSIVITDEDFEKNAKITLTCNPLKSINACEYFGITGEELTEGNYVGIITLIRPLDFEEHSSFSLWIQASDGQHDAQIPVSIRILDIQDQSPRFIGGPYVFQVKENSIPGTIVGSINVQDGDVGNPRNLQIRLIDEEQNNYFRLINIQKDPFNGTFSATLVTSDEILDAEEEFIRESLGVYELSLEAREIPFDAEDIEPTLVTKVGLAVLILDEDDNLPAFEPPQFPYILRIPYNLDESWTFPKFQLEVEDFDEDPLNAKFNLGFNWDIPSIDSVEVDQVFGFVTPPNLNPHIQSKGIVTIEVLNISLLEPGSKFNLEIGAYQHDHLVSKINIPIEVAPSPKILPVFNSTIFRAAVSEEVHEGEILTTLRVINHDQLKSIKYSLAGIGSEKFHVNENTGSIECAIENCLDFERERHHFFLVKAQSGSKVEDNAYALLYLDTLPKNDESPIFSEAQTIRRSVPDQTTTFDPPFFITATDADINDQLVYSLIDYTKNSSGIYIDPISGEIKLKKPLSWEEAGEHKLSISVTDESGNTAVQSVILIVQPVENIPPTFRNEKLKLEIAENTIGGTQIFQAIAHDPDGQDISLRYFIHSQPEPDLFTMDEKTGILTLNQQGKLDYETKQKKYPLVIRVQDEGNPSENAKLSISIYIQDVNDELPVFRSKRIVVDMSESSKVGHNIVQLMATDADENSELEYSISCPCQVWDATGSIGNSEAAKRYFSHLKIDPKSGQIVLATSLEHKTTSVLEFTGIVTDKNGLNPQNDSTSITIYNTAAERLFPYFGEPWSPTNPWINLTIPEDMEIGSHVATLNAWDYVSDEEILNFNLIEDSDVPFDLQENVLSVGNTLDYEAKKNYIIAIKAIDRRGQESMANMAITVSDTNDHDPVFSKPEYHGKVIENSEYPTPVLTVEASDRDDPQNYGAIRYSLIGPQSDLFTIDELAGVVQVAPGADIDREILNSYTLYVLALDTPAGGPFQRTATATIQIQVTDVNDNDPKCHQKGELFVDEDAQIGTIIGKILCSDPDESPSLIYSLYDESHLDLFTINSKTGTISVAKSLRGRGRAASYLVQAQIDDGEDRTVRTAVEIKIANTIPNDGKPHFTNAKLIGEVSEEAFRGTPVLHIQAEDTDSFDNGEGRLIYRIMKQVYPCKGRTQSSNGKLITREDEVNYFKLDENTGMLSLKNTIDREIHDCISVLVGVEDLGVPPRTDAAWFTINVTDIDDSLPILPKPMRNVELIINETTEINTEIFKFIAHDEDVPPNNFINFELIGSTGAEFFKLLPINNQSAGLVVRNDLDKLEHDELMLAVKCFPKNKKISVPDCNSKVHVKINRNSLTSDRLLSNLDKRTSEMLFGVGTGVPVGNLIGNAKMTPMKTIQQFEQIFHPFLLSKSPYNVSEIFRIDSITGDIFVWDNLKPFEKGSVQVVLTNPYSINSTNPIPIMKKKLKIFITSNSELLFTKTSDYPRISRWVEDIETFLNEPNPKSKINHGIFRLLPFDQSNSPDGKTMVCFQLLENENVMTQEKSLQILSIPEIQDIFLKHSFVDQIEKGCPERAISPAKLTLGGIGRGLWVEQSLVGIASVVAIATLSFITILCLVNRQKSTKYTQSR